MKCLFFSIMLFCVSALAGEGGKGGGVTQPSPPATSSQVISIIAYVKTPLRYALKKVQGFTILQQGQTKDKFSERLYKPNKKGKDVYQLIDSLVFMPKSAGLCEDKLNHNEGKDA